MSLGEKILELRQSNKMTQKQLADLLNVSDKVVSRWETGKSLPDVTLMKDIAKIFNVSISDLYDNIGNVKNEMYINNESIKYIKSNYITIFLLSLSIIFTFVTILFGLDYISIYSRKVTDLLIYIFLTIAFGIDASAIIIKLLNNLNIKYIMDKNIDNEYSGLIKKSNYIYNICLSIKLVVYFVIFVVIVFAFISSNL